MTDRPGIRAPAPAIVACLLLSLYAFGLLAIGLTADWRLRHEDNGAMHTVFALAHRRLGLARTRAHDMFVDRHTGAMSLYGHHPPATSLVLAAAFAVTGSDAPAVARLTVIAFHLGSLLLLVGLLAHLLDWRGAVVGGFLMASLPMSTYFGRMVNYEPLCLFAIMLQLFGYVRCRRDVRGGRPLLAAGVVIGGLIDWPAFFFAAALALVELLDLLRRRTSSRGPLLILLIAAPATFATDIWHLWFAGQGSVEALKTVLSGNRPPWQLESTPARLLFGQLDTFRRYFTDFGLLATVLVMAALLRPRSALSRRLFAVPDAALLTRVLLAAGGAALAYQLAAPEWAMAHQYWQFYFLPAVVIAMVLGWRALERHARERPDRRLRAVQWVVVAAVLAISAYWLHFRHTRPEAYAIETTASFRERYLLPEHLVGR